MIFLKKVWNWLKHYWWVLIFPVVIFYFVFRGTNVDDIKNVLKITKESHEKEKGVLERIERKKLKEEARVKKIHKKAIKEIEVNHSRDLKVNKAHTRKEMKKIVKRFKNNPEGLAKEFAKEFGLNIDKLVGE